MVCSIAMLKKEQKHAKTKRRSQPPFCFNCVSNIVFVQVLYCWGESTNMTPEEPIDARLWAETINFLLFQQCTIFQTWGKSWKLKIDGALSLCFFFLSWPASVRFDGEDESCLIPSDEYHFCFSSDNLTQTYKVERFVRTLCHSPFWFGATGTGTRSCRKASWSILGVYSHIYIPISMVCSLVVIT